MSIVSNDIDVVDEHFSIAKRHAMGHDYEERFWSNENNYVSVPHHKENCKLCQAIKSWETLSERLRYLYT
jgi:hypothetical protein